MCRQRAELLRTNELGRTSHWNWGLVNPRTLRNDQRALAHQDAQRRDGRPTPSFFRCGRGEKIREQCPSRITGDGPARLSVHQAVPAAAAGVFRKQRGWGAMR